MTYSKIRGFLKTINGKKGRIKSISKNGHASRHYGKVSFFVGELIVVAAAPKPVVAI